MRMDESSLEAFLIDTGLAPKKAITLAREESKKTGTSLETILAKQGILTERDLKRASSFLLGIPFVNLHGEDIPYSVLSLIPEPIARRHNVVAFKKEKNLLHVAVVEASDFEEVKFLEDELKLKLKPHLTDDSSIKHALRIYHEGLRKEFGANIQIDSQKIKEDVGGDASDEDLKAFATDDRITRIMDSLISHALLSKANHIHIEPRAGALHIRYRIKGTLHEAMILPKHIHPHLVLHTKHLAGLDLKDESPQEGRMNYESGRDKVNLRVSTMPGTHGEKMVIRKVPTHASGFTLESLGLIGKSLNDVHEMLEEREGLLLVSAPKASGKTTFMYTALDLIHKERHSIHTVEEKVEYLLPGITQSEVNAEKGLTTQRLVRAALRMDPDVLMVSAVEDEGTASLLSSAALRGELVMAGVEADTPAQAILKFGGVAGLGLSASALSGAIGIRLVNRIGKTTEKYFLNAEEIKSLGKLISLPKMLSVLKEEGIVEGDTAWEEVPFLREIKTRGDEDPGKIGLFEVIRANARIRELVMKEGSATSIEGERELGGGLSFLEDGVVKAALGLTSLEEVLISLS